MTANDFYRAVFATWNSILATSRPSSLDIDMRVLFDDAPADANAADLAAYIRDADEGGIIIVSFPDADTLRLLDTQSPA